MKPKWLLPILVLFMVYVFSMQGLKGGPEISAQETANLLKGEPRPVLIDLRDAAQYEQGHIPGALSVQAAQFKEKLADLNLPKVDPIVLYSDDDAKSREATKHLYESGYQGGLTLKGGLAAWQAAGQAVSKPAASPPAK